MDPRGIELSPRDSETKTHFLFLHKQTTPSKILSNFRHPSGGGEFSHVGFY
ncbi:hypothetical protein [Chryseobacterium gregarium]|uniref:hypothetical protein n=1 Tax=Chryseobacterium gregarium TaxID=456299 RepID=UPI0012DCB030|nr:hypothetical protein [Chryseobacterium gregarium]